VPDCIPGQSWSLWGAVCGAEGVVGVVGVVVVLGVVAVEPVVPVAALAIPYVPAPAPRAIAVTTTAIGALIRLLSVG
jgi:hypothetical protein